jgi:hypothetical protein
MENKFEIPLEEWRKRASKQIEDFYNLPCPDVECPDCPAYIPTPAEGPYIGCMICRLFERINPEVKP